MSLNVNSLGIALGLTSVLGVVVLGLASMVFGVGAEMVAMLSTLYLGYDMSIQGIVVGAIWAFIDGLIMGIVFATMYNKLVS